jgi:predicted short-subunit dehydrogenase-like oxidoreductase (DUF2520 family)
LADAIRVGFIGAGTVGTALGVTLTRAGYGVAAVYSRTPASAERFAGLVPSATVCSSGQEVTDRADFIFITTPDDVIASVARQLQWRPGLSVIHCSGVASTDIIEPARSQGAAVGAFHPLQSFANIDQAIQNVPGSTFAIEGEEPLLGALVGMARALDGVPVVLQPGDKVLYHAAAVIVSNYAVGLMKMATDLWQVFGVDSRTATEALLPLLRGTVNNIANVGLPNCLTGPVARGDVGTIENHLRVLADRAPSLLPVYCHLGLQILPVALGKGKVDAEKADQMRNMLAHKLAQWVATDSL